MTQTSDILIAGGGLVGSAIALSLAREGFAVTLFEREKEGAALVAGYDGRVSAISEASRRVFAHLGLWEALAPDAGPIRDIRIANGDSTAKVHFDHRDLGEEPFGHMIENFRLRRALAEAVANEPGVTLHHEAEATSVTQTSAQATLSLANGESHAAPLLIAADGKRSRLRELLGIKARKIEYDQVAMVATIAHALPHEGIAVELFLPAGPLAVLPMTGNRACIVWTERAARAGYYLGLPEAEFAAEIERVMRGYLGAVELLGARHSYPLSLVQAERYVAPRAALIGDAAHGIHPIAGQGVNLGYRDVAALTQLLGEARSLGLDHGASSVLERYQSWRRFDATGMTMMTDGLNRLFSNDALPVKALRRLGMRAFDRVPPVKRFFMLNAMGLSGDLPEMLKGAAA